MVFESLSNIIDGIMSPFLAMPPLWAIILLSFVLSIIITVIYKYVTDQELMKTLKADMKAMQKEIKNFKNNPQKMMELQKKSMEKNMKYMMHSLKPTLITFIPLILIFAWLNSHLAYHPLMPGQEFGVNIEFNKGVTGDITLFVPEGVEVLSNETKNIQSGSVRWTLKGDLGRYVLNYKLEGIGKEYQSEIVITNGKEYVTPIQKLRDPYVKKITVENEKIKPLNLFGWRIGWIGTYIIFSLIFSMGLRKILKVH